MSHTYLVVTTSPLPGREEEYHAWYDGTHLSDVLALDGVVSAQRFDQAPVGKPDAGSDGYVAMYELDGDPQTVLQALQAGIGSGRIALSDSVDPSATSMTVWEARGPVMRADA